MLIADSQVHVWGPETPDRPWRVGPVKPHDPVPLTPERLLGRMDEAGVHRAVLVPPSWDADRNDLVLAAARRLPDRFAAMGRLNLKAPDARAQFDALRREPGMAGFRCSFNHAEWVVALTGGSLDWLWQDAERHAVPMMVLVTQAHVATVDRIAERHPGLKLTLCHLALTSGKSEADTFRDFDKLLPIAKRPNVCVKWSALPTYTEDAYPFRRLHPYLRRVFDAFGPKRIFWGTDLSRFRNCTYRQSITMITEEIPWLGPDDKAWIMGRGLCEWLGWRMR